MLLAESTAVDMRSNKHGTNGLPINFTELKEANNMTVQVKAPQGHGKGPCDSL